MTTAALTMTNLDPDAPPVGWSLDELGPFVMATLGQRDALLKQNETFQVQLYGGEFAGHLRQTTTTTASFSALANPARCNVHCNPRKAHAPSGFTRCNCIAPQKCLQQQWASGLVVIDDATRL